MKLSTLQVWVNSNIIDEHLLNIIFKNNEEYYSDKEYHYKIEDCGAIKENIFWLYARYGSTTPYSEDIIDIDSYEHKENPRNMKEVEPRNQLFCIYDNQSKLLFVNNLKMKSRIQKLFQHQLNKVNTDFLIRIDNVIISLDSFAQHISSINEVKLKYRQNLLNSHTLGALDMFPSPKELLGVSVNEEPDYQLSIKLHHAKVIDGFLKKFKKLVEMRRDGDLTDLVIIGKDSNLIDTVFKLDSITKNLFLDIKEDEDTKQFDSEKVKYEFLKELKRLY